MAGSLLRCASLALATATSAATIFDFFQSQANATLSSVPMLDAYPANGQCEGCYAWSTSAYNGWTSGFWPGILFKLYNYTSGAGAPGADYWLQQGIARAAAIKAEQYDNSTHDVGFMVFTSFGQQYQLTGNTTARDIALTTASTLTERFSPVVGCIESWGHMPPPNDQFEVIIDNMMNLELLWWAAATSGNTTFSSIATSHADHMIDDIFQPFAPGCVWHLVTYNYTSGDILNRSSTPQGLGLDTVWSRGQGWATLGFMIAYRYSGQPRYLQTAQAAADCFIRLLDASAISSGDYIPLWDFNATDPKLYGRDTSAAAIAADGMIEIAWHTADPGQAAGYLAAARKILDSLEGAYSYQGREAASPAFVSNGTVTFPLTGIPLVYGDYYTMEALMKWDATPQTSKDAARARMAEAAAAAAAAAA